MSLNSSPGRPCYYVHSPEAKAHMRCAYILRFIETAIHELIGHGTGKLLAETAAGNFNVDHKNPPISPVTGWPVQTWYGPGETWKSVFGKLAPTVESTPTADDLIYYTYVQIGVEGLRALHSFKVEDQDGDGTMWVEHDPIAKRLFIHVDRSKLVSHGKPSIGRMLCRIHIWQSTADLDACRPFYEDLSAVDGEYEIWRQIVVSNPEPMWKFVQPNTFLRDDGTVELREYEANNVGLIQSFFERRI